MFHQLIVIFSINKNFYLFLKDLKVYHALEMNLPLKRLSSPLVYYI
jgi:hypothetical protein